MNFCINHILVVAHGNDPFQRGSLLRSKMTSTVSDYGASVRGKRERISGGTFYVPETRVCFSPPPYHEETLISAKTTPPPPSVTPHLFVESSRSDTKCDSAAPTEKKGGWWDWGPPPEKKDDWDWGPISPPDMGPFTVPMPFERRMVTVKDELDTVHDNMTKWFVKYCETLAVMTGWRRPDWNVILLSIGDLRDSCEMHWYMHNKFLKVWEGAMKPSRDDDAIMRMRKLKWHESYSEIKTFFKEDEIRERSLIAKDQLPRSHSDDEWD